MSRKKVFGILAASVMCLALSACGKKESIQTAEQGNKTESASSGEMGYQTVFWELSDVEGRIKDAAVIEGTVYFTTAPDASVQQSGRILYQMKDGAVTVTELGELSENQSIAAMCAGQDGNLLLAVASMGESAAYELRTVTPDGKTLESKDITENFLEEPALGISKMAADSKGNVYIQSGGALKVFDSTGSLSFEVNDVRITDVACSGYDEAVVAYVADTRDIHTGNVDVENKKIGDDYKDLGGDRISFAASSSKGLVYYSGDMVCEYTKDQGRKELFSLLGNNINRANMDVMAENAEGEFVVFTTKRDDSSGSSVWKMSEAAELKLVDASTLPVKTEISYGTLMIDGSTADMVVDFNKKSDQYKIIVKEYMGADYDMQAAKDGLNMDIVTGKGPDIIDLYNAGSVDLYMNRGLLEDLKPFMEQDEEISKGNYLENILDIYEKDGKRYAIVPIFFIRSIVGKESVIGDGESWSAEEMMKLAEGMKEGQRLFPVDITKSSLLLNVCLPADLDHYINWETGECKFDSPEFIELLEFVNQYGSTPEEASQYDYRWVENYRSNKVLLQCTFLANVSNCYSFEEVCGEKLNFIGYPVQEGCGSKIFPACALGIMASSDQEKKEGAWQFVRQFLLKDYQEKIGFTSGFPVDEDVLLQRYEEAMTPVYGEDENGNQIEVSRFTDMYDDQKVEIYALSKEDVDEIDYLIRSVDGAFKTDGQVNAIIEEEAGAYFGGAKTAEEAAGVIQSRVQLYVKENQ